MKLRFPLYAKILGWFFLNLALLGVAARIILIVNFRIGVESALLGYGEARVQTLTDLVVAELSERPRSEWDEILRRYSAAYRLDLRVYENNGQWLAGTNTPLPGIVQSKLVERTGEVPDRPDGPGRRPPPDFPPEAGSELPEPIPPRAPPPDNNASVAHVAPRISPKFLLRAPRSPHYWLLARTMLNPTQRQRTPVSLIAASGSIGFNGLLLDLRPWLLAIGTAALVSALFWLPLVRGLTRSLAQMNHATQQIAEGRFDVRVAEGRHDELGSLGQAVNRMAERLAGFVTGQKRFLGDVAHELCAPLARVQVALGILEQRADPAQKTYVEDLREEVQHMSSLVNELLSFSKAGMKAREVKLETVLLRPIIDRVLARETSAPDQIEVNVPADVEIMAEPELLERALANVVRNAIRYAGQAGPITIMASAQGSDVLISVADQGPGVPEAALSQIGDPFFRPEVSRSRETGGVGLGFAIVKTCVEACQGKLSLRNRQPTGLQVEMTFRSRA